MDLRKEHVRCSLQTPNVRTLGKTGFVHPLFSVAITTYRQYVVILNSADRIVLLIRGKSADDVGAQ